MTDRTTTARTSEIYDAIDAFQRTHRLPGLQHAQIRGLLAEHLARVLPAVSAVRPTATDRTAVCICGHTEQQHFEDVCITEITGCDCGDFLPPDAAREVIDRWRQAAFKARTDRAAVLREAADHLAAQADQLWMPGTKAHTVMHADADELRRLAAGPAAVVSGRTADETQAEARPSCPDTIECDHEAALGQVEVKLARVREWATSDAVTARTEFGEGYRACQRDVRDLIDGRIGPAVGGAQQPKEA